MKAVRGMKGSFHESESSKNPVNDLTVFKHGSMLIEVQKRKGIIPAGGDAGAIISIEGLCRYICILAAFR